LYAERLAAESGWYGDDVAGQLGQLNFELFRARRLVVDTVDRQFDWRLASTGLQWVERDGC
jgi:uncharacterized protein (DUF885 family)